MKEIIIDEVIYRIGKDARDNTQLIKDSQASWTWFHLEKFPSCHVIICKDEPTILEINNAATLVKTNSKYKFKNIGINYCKIDNLIHGSKDGSVQFISNRQVKSIYL